MTSTVQAKRLQNRLRIVRLFALFDLVLLIALVWAALTGHRDIVHILGPLHGINYLLLLVIVAVAALDGIWGWWFPLAVLLTAGPLGAFIGEWIMHRRLSASSVVVQESATSTPQAERGGN
jgi:hypothetical protein